MNFQQAANQQGKAFFDEALMALHYAGFEIEETNLKLKDVGIVIDAVTINYLGTKMVWSFKGSWRGNRPGLLRTDTVKKTIADAWLFQQSKYAHSIGPGMMVVTSHIPTEGSAAQMLQTAKTLGIIHSIVDSRKSSVLMRLNNWYYMKE